MMVVVIMMMLVPLMMMIMVMVMRLMTLGSPSKQAWKMKGCTVGLRTGLYRCLKENYKRYRYIYIMYNIHIYIYIICVCVLFLGVFGKSRDFL